MKWAFSFVRKEWTDAIAGSVNSDWCPYRPRIQFPNYWTHALWIPVLIISNRINYSSFSLVSEKQDSDGWTVKFMWVGGSVMYNYCIFYLYRRKRSVLQKMFFPLSPDTMYRESMVIIRCVFGRNIRFQALTPSPKKWFIKWLPESILLWRSKDYANINRFC